MARLGQADRKKTAAQGKPFVRDGVETAGPVSGQDADWGR